MRALLDVNFVIGLLDPDHPFHSAAHSWWAKNEKHGWASCPLTENGVVHIMSNPGYSKKVRFTPVNLIDHLQKFSSNTDHAFWPDDISLRDSEIFLSDRIHSPRQLTDLYLLALAVKHQGRLVTFDQGIPLSAIPTATTANLCVV